jgi:hypothetical protein
VASKPYARLLGRCAACEKRVPVSVEFGLVIAKAIGVKEIGAGKHRRREERRRVGKPAD